VDAIQRANDGSPSLTEIVKLSGAIFSRDFDLRENDVFLLTLTRL
jgi:hypothetical protein